MTAETSTEKTATAPAATGRAPRNLKWRVVDIVVAAVIGVAAGLIFLAWNVGYIGPKSLLEPALPGLQGLLNGPWLFAGVLGGIIIRKPGAAIFTELLAAVVSALVGNQWGGVLTLEAGLVQGLGAELVLLAFLYGNYRVWVAVLAGAGAGLLGSINDLILWYAGADTAFSIIYVVSSVVGGAVIAGLGSWLIAKALAQTGALNRFAAGREATAEV
ncbi:MAG: ECF transporter S component [Microbacteriaceae bacterium]|nr:ECF transporter S component [Microbacteriaceae bacterium]